MDAQLHLTKVTKLKFIFPLVQLSLQDPPNRSQYITCVGMYVCEREWVRERTLIWALPLNHFIPLWFYFETLGGKNHHGAWRGLFLFLAVASGFPAQCPTHMLEQMVWTLGGQFSCSRTWSCLISSTWLSFSSSWGRSVIPISLISLMRAQGTDPHFEFGAQYKLLCLAPSLIISAFKRRTALRRNRRNRRRTASWRMLSNPPRKRIFHSLSMRSWELSGYQHELESRVLPQSAFLCERNESSKSTDRSEIQLNSPR